MLNSIIKITKKSEQGLSLSIIRHTSIEYANLVEELIEEGKAEIFITHYSSLPSDEWVVPAGCYNVMKDNETEHPGALTFMRIYLGIDDLGIGLKISDVLKNVNSMEKYAKWLKDNNKKLIDLTNMQEIELIPNQLDDNTKNWIKSKKWYTYNDTIESCLNQSLKFEKDNTDHQQIDLYDDLMLLYNTNKNKYSDAIEEAKKDIELLKENIKYRNIVNKWLQNQIQTAKIQTIIK